MGEKRHAYRFLVGKSVGRRPNACTWKDNIKVYIKEIGWWCGLDSSGSDKDQWWALLKTAVKGLYKMLRISCVDEELVASEAGLSSVRLVATYLTAKFGVACVN
jgi:hypothetical protein